MGTSSVDKPEKSLAWAAVVALGVAACSTPARTDDPHLAVTSSARASETPSSSPVATPKYDVHEWGLVRADQGDKVRVGAVAPPIPPEILIIDKPVLYFRADAPLTLHRVSVLAPGGSVVETWPLAQRGTDGQLGWSDVSVDPTSPCRSSPLPRKVDAPCSKLPPGDECESAGLAAVRSFDASCIRVGDKTETFLFYRVSTSSLTPPLRFASQENGDVRVQNDGEEPLPGFLIRIGTIAAATRTLTVRPPPPHGSIVVGHDFPAATRDDPGTPEDVGMPGSPRPRKVTGPAREDLRSTMRELGMADTEVDAFMKAWDATLFGRPTEGGFRPIDEETSFLYFLPESTLERVAKVSFDPPPRSFRRAFAVWTHLAASGEAR